MMREIAVTLTPGTVADLDGWVREGQTTRLIQELNKLDPVEEGRLADEGLGLGEVGEVDLSRIVEGLSDLIS